MQRSGTREAFAGRRHVLTAPRLCVLLPLTYYDLSRPATTVHACVNVFVDHPTKRRAASFSPIGDSK